MDRITATENGSSSSYISSWNQHDYYYYIGVSTNALTMSSFMDLSTTSNQPTDWTRQVQQAHTTNYPYALREMGVVGPIGLDGITNVFAASLWTLNFFFYAATLNISSVQMHMTDNSLASAWQPIEMDGINAYVRPNYYAWPAFDQTIGTSCQASVAALTVSDIPSKYINHVGAYAVYQDNSLASIVVLNTAIANTSTSPRPSLTVSLRLPSSLAGQTLYLSYLTNEGADARNGTTWNGISYEQDPQGTPTVINGTIITTSIGSDGSVSIPIQDTEAVVANIGSVVGSNNTGIGSACSDLASSVPDSTLVSPSGAPISVSTISGGSRSTATAHVKSGVGRAWSMDGILVLGVVILAIVQGFVIMF